MNLNNLRRTFLAAFLLLCASAGASAQTFDVKIEVVSLSPARARVEGKREGGATVWSFRKTYAGVGGLGERVEKLALSDEAGAAVPFRQLAPGEFEAARPASRFAYELKLDPPGFITDAPHVSWLVAEHGLLMLGDVLPLAATKARVSLVLPAGWNASTADEREAANAFSVTDVQQSVFALGRALRERRGRAGALEFVYAAAGVWAFADEEAAGVFGELLKIYEKMSGGAPRRRVMLALVPLPRPGGANVWGAETRGGTVTLISGRLPSNVAALAQLNGSLTHEALHLWVPNGLALDGDYDWFYEGFTNYTSVRVALAREQLRFQDYLAALGRAFDAYKAARGGRELSLVDASQRRWAGGTPFIYHKGMLVAFLYDLTLMLESNGRSSMGDVYRELFQSHGGGQKREDGNNAVVNVLGRMPGMRGFTERYVQHPTEIDLAAALAPFGLIIEPGGARTHVGVSASLNRAQREMLRKLGYNEKSEADSRKLHERLKTRRP